MPDLTPFLLTFQLALLTTVLLLLPGLGIAYWLAYGRSRWRVLVEVLVMLPLVLPPTVLGFYLLLALSPESALGHWLLEHFNIRLLFSFSGLVLGSLVYSLPFMVQPLRAGFQRIPQNLREAAYVLGKSEWTTFYKVLLPNMRPALLTAIVLTFAHTVGEFGVVLMIGGNLPGKTRVASIAIYEAVESLEYSNAHWYAGLLLLFTFLILLLVFVLGQGRKTSWP